MDAKKEHKVSVRFPLDAWQLLRDDAGGSDLGPHIAKLLGPKITALRLKKAKRAAQLQALEKQRTRKPRQC